MIDDARDLEPGAILECDICIVGAGAAGITLARELSGTRLRILVLESGGTDFEEDTQALCEGTNVNPLYPGIDHFRLRFFGGTTNHWEGNCSPLDPIDFEARDWVPHSGWPFKFSEIAPFYERAQEYCQLEGTTFDTESWLRAGKLKPLPLDPRKLVSRIARMSPPTRFGEVYRDDLTRAGNVRVLLHANALTLEASANGATIETVRCAVLDGHRFDVRARIVVVATGGVENARLLLLSDSVRPNGLGNDFDMVGRFFMDHPVVTAGILYPSGGAKALAAYLGPAQVSERVGAYMTIAEGALRQRRLMGVRAPFVAIDRYFASEGIESMHILRDWLGGEKTDNIWRHIGNVLTDIDMVAEAVSRKAFNKRLFDRANDRDFFMFDTMIEQTPDPESRVRLAKDMDRLGQRRVSLDWRLAEADKRNVWRCFELIAAEIGRAGLGRIRLFDDQPERIWDELLSFGYHHMGTTRASDDPKAGVVDANLKVHGMSNLYVAGSSVFTTGGHVPPTLTIVALAIRMAAHLKAEIDG